MLRFFYLTLTNFYDNIKKLININFLMNLNFETINNESLEDKILSSLSELNKYDFSQLNNEKIEEISGLKVEEIKDYFNNQQTDEKFKNYSQLIEAIGYLAEDKTLSRQEKWWRNFSQKFVKKIGLTTLALFLLFKADPGKAQDSFTNKLETGELSDNMEASFSNNGQLAETYVMSEKDLKISPDSRELESDFEDLERYSSLDISHYFSTDLAEISNENKDKIEENFKNFLSKINKNNFNELIESDFKVYGSSDERPTSNWGEDKGDGEIFGNEKLARSRVQAFINKLQPILKNYSFENSDLSAEQIELIRNKEFIIEIAESVNGEEKGVTYISDLENPETGKLYSPEEIENIKQNDEAKYLELLSQCRRVSVDFLALNTHMIPKLELIKPELNISSMGDIIEWKGKKNVKVIVDNSPSIRRTYEHTVEILSNQEDLIDTDIYFATFSDKLNEVEKLDNLSALVDTVRNMEKTGHHHERVLHSVIEALKLMPEVNDDEENLLLAITDELFQNINLDLLEEAKILAKENNTKVYLIFAQDRAEKIAQAVDLISLESKYKEIMLQRFGPQAHKFINLSERKINSYKANLDRHTRIIESMISRDVELSRRDKRDIASRQVEILETKANLEDLELIVQSLKPLFDSQDIISLLDQEVFKKHLSVRNPNWQSRLTVNIRPDENLGSKIDLSR